MPTISDHFPGRNLGDATSSQPPDHFLANLRSGMIVQSRELKERNDEGYRREMEKLRNKKCKPEEERTEEEEKA